MDRGENSKRIPRIRERVTSTYAEIYLNDDYCDYEKPSDTESSKSQNGDINEENWVSPSDLLIGILELKPPFTSKITRGKTHQGILEIGNGVLQIERAKFLAHLKGLLEDNDKGWLHTLNSEKHIIDQKVKKIYNEIFLHKSKIMTKEMAEFYAESLQELEDNMRSELESVLVSAYANIISESNFEIKQKLAKEREILEDVLRKRYESEVFKIEKYYKLLFDNELNRISQLVNHAVCERNDALSAFHRQIEAENLTSTMYVMCTERKKCKIKQFITENYQTTEINEKIEKIKDRQETLESYRKRDVHIAKINKDWEDKIKKILQLFIKFISFSLKLLPEQSTFLLDLERMMVLQMNEILKHPQKSSSILIDEDELNNILKFEECPAPEPVCKEKPFVIVGTLNDPTPPRYGSTETLRSDVDLPHIRVQRQFLYAKCHKFEEIKALLESQRCKCEDIPTKDLSIEVFPDISPLAESLSVENESISSDETLLIDDMKRLHECPARNCQDWTRRMSFPQLNSYLDFTEENYSRVTAILDVPRKILPPPDLLNPKLFVIADLPFLPTKEPHHDVETQYSSQEDLHLSEAVCSCVDYPQVKKSESIHKVKESSSKELRNMLRSHKDCIRDILQNNPTLLKVFTDECFDFIL